MINRIEEKINVLIVDDSAVVRGMLTRAIETDQSIAVAATAMHGDAALRALRKTPVDVVILDVEMPVMDGLTALPLILQEFPDVRVIMASALTREGAAVTVKALALGAAGCIPKPNANSMGESIQQLVVELVPLIKALGSHKSSSTTPAAVDRNNDPVPAPPPATRRMGTLAVPPAVVVIGTSTGGPNALSKVLSELPPDFSTPILIVQHMPPLFTPMLAKHLQMDGKRPCQEATHGGLIERGHTYVAPGDYHMLIDQHENRMVTLLNQDPPEHYCRPSVNPLFRSAAKWHGNRVLAVMLTGMGDDGIEGTRDIAKRSGQIIAQDEASSVVWGMPGAVAREKLADYVLPLDHVATMIQRLCSPEYSLL
ncbi:MAG: chemotaxis response regulator protein-glutamate methylesterase [Planctomycetales bacterium]